MISSVTGWIERHRGHTLEELSTGYARGHLGLDTLEVRTAEALRARSVPELQLVTWDLPRRMRPRGLVCERVCFYSGTQHLSTLKLADRRGTWTIGRSRASDVVLPPQEVSRAHAQLSQRGGWCVVRDLRSTNGMWLNEKPVRGVRLLRPGDELVFPGGVSALVR